MDFCISPFSLSHNNLTFVIASNTGLFKQLLNWNSYKVNCKNGLISEPISLCWKSTWMLHMNKMKLNLRNISMTLLFWEILFCFAFVLSVMRLCDIYENQLEDKFGYIYIYIYKEICKLNQLIPHWPYLSASLRLYFFLFAQENCSYLQRQVWNSIKLKLLSYCRIQTTNW